MKDEEPDSTASLAVSQKGTNVVSTKWGHCKSHAF